MDYFGTFLKTVQNLTGQREPSNRELQAQLDRIESLLKELRRKT